MPPRLLLHCWYCQCPSHQTSIDYSPTQLHDESTPCQVRFPLAPALKTWRLARPNYACPHRDAAQSNPRERAELAKYRSQSPASRRVQYDKNS
ncbi:Uncharacterised protein [Vibrio cholerae]|nr:Uncharacterised protein [Vibrio cholerae]